MIIISLQICFRMSQVVASRQQCWTEHVTEADNQQSSGYCRILACLLIDSEYIEATCSRERSGDFGQSTRRHISEDTNLLTHYGLRILVYVGVSLI
jgi:hypothetical protein